MLKKLLTYTLAITTMVWSVGLLATPLAVGAAVSGDLIKLQCSTGASVNDPCKAVYYLGANGKRYVFPTESTYSTWYSDFSGVKIVSSTEMSSYPLGGNVTVRPGTKMIKITTDPKVYAVADNGSIRWVTTGAIAEAIYGANWNKMILDIPDSYFINYAPGADINAAADFNKTAQMDNSPTINDDKNLAGGGDGGNVSTGTSLTVSLAADTPASGLLLGNTINNKFTKVNLTASADGDIVIDQLTVKRGSLGSDAAFSSIALIDAATDQRIGNTKSLNSEHNAVFNEDMTIPAGTTKSVYLAGNMGSLASYAGEVPTLELFAITLAGNAAVIGSLPISGNYQNLNGTITVGALTVANGSNNPSALTQKIGQTNYILSGVKLTANSVESFTVNKITFDQGGTASDGDVGNFDLLIDDVQKGTVASSVGGKVTFTLNPALVIEKGKSVQVDLRGDILDGSARTARFDIQDESDVRAMGNLYNAEVKVAAGSGATADAEPFWTAPVTTIDQGSLRIGAATLSAANIPEDDDDIVLGKFEFEAKGEPIVITRLPINFTVTTSSGTGMQLDNVRLVDANGKIVAGPVDATSNLTGNMSATSTDTITIPTGTNVYTVMADLDADWVTNDTIIARINPGQLTAKGDVTDLSVTATPSTDQTSATMTVKTAALSVAVGNTPIAQSVVKGTKNHTFANVVLGAEASGEDIKVTTVRVQIDCTTCSPSEFSNWSIFDGATELSVTNDPDSQTTTKTTANDNATSTFTFTTPIVVTRGASKTLTVKADISNSVSASDTIKVGIQDATTPNGTVTAKGNTSSNDAALTVSVNAGQLQTIQSSGLLTITRDSSSPDAGLIPASSSGVTLGVFSASAQYEDVNIEKLYLTGIAANSGGWDQIQKLYIYDGSTKLAEVSPTSTDGTNATVLVDVTSKPIVITKDTSKKLTLKADTSGANYEIGSTGTSGQGLWIKINAAGDITAKGAQSGASVSSPSITNASTTAQYLFRSVPTVTPNEDLASGVTGGALSSKTNEPVYKFSVSASSAGPVALYQVQFLVTTSTATTTNWVLTDGATNVAATTTAQHVVDGANGSDTMLVVLRLTSDGAVPASGDINIEPYVITAGATKTFTLRADLTCSTVNCAAASSATGGSVSYQLLGDTALPSTLPNSAGTLDNDLYESSFIWGDLWRTPIQEVSSTSATTTEQWSNGYLVAEADGGKLAATSTAVSFTK